MKKMLISLILLAIGISLGIFISIEQKDNFYGYYTKADKEISQNIEKSIEFVSLNNYSKVTYNFKNVKQIFLVGPYNWIDNDFIEPFNNPTIISNWKYSLAEEDKYLLILVNNEHFLPVILLRKYSKDDFKNIQTSLLRNKSCNKQTFVKCKIENNIGVDIIHIGKENVDITIAIKGNKNEF